MNNELNKNHGHKENIAANNVPNNNYKKAFWGVLSFSAVLLLFAAFLFINNEKQNNEKINQIAEQNEFLTDSVQQRDSIINELAGTFNEIEKDLNTMRDKENLLAVQSDNPEFSEDMRDRILKDIQKLNSLLKENKQKVASLSKKLKNSGIKISALEDKIDILEASLVRRDSSIMDLKMQLVDRNFVMAELNVVIDSLNTEVDKKEKVISSKQAELNKAYLVSGSLKELQEKGVVVKQGGFLGLGKTTDVTDNLPEDQFSQIDINKVSRIDINAKKAEIISEHPKNSYQMVSNDSLIAYLEITQPKEFWKITRFAVLETK